MSPLLLKGDNNPPRYLVEIGGADGSTEDEDDEDDGVCLGESKDEFNDDDGFLIFWL